MKYWESEEFKALNKRWKKKLKASGFKEIELGDDELVRYSYHLTQAYREGTADYYLKASEFLLTHTFKNKTDRLIWSLHADGRSCRQISSELAKRTAHPKLGHTAVHGRICAIEALMLETAVPNTEISRTTQNKRTGS